VLAQCLWRRIFATGRLRSSRSIGSSWVASAGSVRRKSTRQGRGIVFQVRARAIGLAPKDRWIDLTLWLKSGATQPRVRKIDDYGPLGRVLHFRLTRKEDLDPALARLLAEAYAVAAQREVKRVRRSRVTARSGRGS
jgi:hypothetical protein